MRKRLATVLLVLAGFAGFAAGSLLVPGNAEASCKVQCCPGTDICFVCCQAPCPTYVCPP